MPRRLAFHAFDKSPVWTSNHIDLLAACAAGAPRNTAASASIPPNATAILVLKPCLFPFRGRPSDMYTIFRRQAACHVPYSRHNAIGIGRAGRRTLREHPAGIDLETVLMRNSGV